jgi:hypothetical protein
MRLYSTGLHIGRFEPSGNSLLSKSIKISDGKITFIRSSVTNQDFFPAESVIYNTVAGIWQIQIHETEEGTDLRIDSDKAIDKFILSNGNDDNLILNFTGLINIDGNVNIVKNLGIGENTVVKPYVSSEGENHNGIDFMI